MVRISFAAEAISWRGPSPFVFVPVPEAACADIKAVARELSYGWGVIPVTVSTGASVWKTSLFPKDGRYLVPIKLAIQVAEGIEPGRRLELAIAL